MINLWKNYHFSQKFYVTCFYVNTSNLPPTYYIKLHHKAYDIQRGLFKKKYFTKRKTEVKRRRSNEVINSVVKDQIQDKEVDTTSYKINELKV